MKRFLLIVLCLFFALASISLAIVPKNSKAADVSPPPATTPVFQSVSPEITPLPSYVKKINVSGSLRIRYAFYEAANQLDAFSISRGRIKIVADVAPDASFLVQPDFAALSTGGTVALADAYAELKLPITNLKIGQFLVPFAYDSGKYKTIYSTGLNPTHYGTIVAARDYGLRLSGPFPNLSGFYYDGAIINGTGAVDTNKSKDIAGRVNYKNDFIDIGLSGYYGRAGTTSTETSKKDIGLYVEYKNSALQLVAEYLLGQNLLATAKIQETYVQLSAPLGRFEPLVKYEVYDPNVAAAGNIVNTLTIGGSYALNKEMKLLLNYNIVGEETAQTSNNALLLELQTQI